MWRLVCAGLVLGPKTRHERRSVCGGAVGAKVPSKARLSGRSKNERGREWAGERVGD